MSAGTVLTLPRPVRPAERTRLRPLRLADTSGRAAISPPPARERRSQDALSRLSREHDRLVTSAVHPWEVAAGLEAAGVTDAQARARFGVPDVFVLADELYAASPRRFRPAPDTDPDRAANRRAVVRGLLYAVPMLFALAVAPLLGADGQGLLLAALVAAWSWSQGVTSLGHRRLGLGDVPGARRVLGGGAVVGALLWAAVSAGELAAGTAVVPVVVAAAQVVQFLSSAVVVVLGGEVVLLAVLVPGATVALVSLASPGTVGQPLLAAAMLLSVLAGVVVAVRLVGRPRAAAPLAWAEVAGAVPYVVHGAALAMLLVAGLSVRPAGSAGGLADTAALPVVAAMALGEQLLHRYRQRMRGLLEGHCAPEVFRPLARRALARVLGVFLAAIVLATGAVQAVAAALDAAPSEHVLFGVAYAALGSAMFGAVLLVSLGEVRAAVRVSLPTATLLWLGLTAAGGTNEHGLAVIFALGCGAFLAATTALALSRVGRVWVHR